MSMGSFWDKNHMSDCEKMRWLEHLPSPHGLLSLCPYFGSSNMFSKCLVSAVNFCIQSSPVECLSTSNCTQRSPKETWPKPTLVGVHMNMQCYDHDGQTLSVYKPSNSAFCIWASDVDGQKRQMKPYDWTLSSGFSIIRFNHHIWDQVLIQGTPGDYSVNISMTYHHHQASNARQNGSIRLEGNAKAAATRPWSHARMVAIEMLKETKRGSHI